jgi:predicted lysophospholipase L1 biosynthesis ABC-type transport system permease subunit
LLAGRDFNDHDDLSAPLAIVINETAARQFFASSNPLGRTIRTKPADPDSSELYHVIGVVEDAKYRRIDEETPKTGFVAMAQASDPWSRLQYEVRYTGSSEALAAGVRTTVAEVSPDISLEFRSLKTQVAESLQQPRVVALLSTAFGGLALLLAMVGLYGVTSYSVTRRKGEIGVRMALGARAGSVLWLVLRDVTALLAAGTALGILGALAAGRLVTSLLFGVEPDDPIHMAVAAAMLATATTLAAYLPARRAARLDPMTVLREE